MLSVGLGRSMKRQKLEIGHPLAVKVTWYDKVPEPPQLSKGLP
jgi:hypothetical protein